MEAVLEINVFKNDEVMVVSSREVAQNFEKQHKDVLESIRNLVAENSAARLFFIESSYENRGRQYPEYLLTRDGFSLLVMGFTGQKALEWKLKYIEAFNKMEEKLTRMNDLTPELQMFKQIFDSMVEQQRKQKEQDEKLETLDNKLDNIRDIAAFRPDNWRKEVTDLVKRIAYARGNGYFVKAVYGESYALLEQRINVNLARRVTFKRKRMAKQGICVSAQNAVSKIDVISEDKKLTEAYIAILKELAIKYGADIGK